MTEPEFLMISSYSFEGHKECMHNFDGEAPLKVIIRKKLVSEEYFFRQNFKEF